MEKLKETYHAVNEGMVVRGAARIHDVHRTSLRDRLADSKGLDVKRGDPAIISRVHIARR